MNSWITGGAPDSSPQNRREFPYEEILAYCRGDLGPEERLRIETEWRGSKRFAAHCDSVRYLDLERAAARHDAAALATFASATDFCREVARTGGEVLLRFIRKDQEEALGKSRKEWDRHVNPCVYCRRMRRLMQSRFVRETHDVPQGEQLLRDWLLDRHYREALEQATKRLQKPPGDAGAFGQLDQIAEKLRHKPPSKDPTIVAFARLSARDFMKVVEAVTVKALLAVPCKERPNIPDVMEHLQRDAESVARLRKGLYDTLGLELASFCSSKGYAESDKVLAVLTPHRIREEWDEFRKTSTLWGRLVSTG